MNIFIQLVSFKQGVDQFKLFELARNLLGTGPVKEYYNWVGLKGRVTRADSLTKLHEIAKTVKFSQIGYTSKFRSFAICPGVMLEEAFGVLEIPSTSPLWAGSEYWKKSNVPVGYRRAGSARRIESFVMRSEVNAFPAVLELTLRVSFKLKQDELVSAIAKWISEAFDCDAISQLVCGVADFGDNMLYSKIEIVNLSAAEYSIVLLLSRFVLGTPLLATRIDRLHRIHIHKPKLLSSVADEFGLSKPLKLGKELAVLAVPKAIIENPSSEMRIAKFSIPKDESTSWAGIVKRSET